MNVVSGKCLSMDGWRKSLTYWTEEKDATRTSRSLWACPSSTSMLTTLAVLAMLAAVLAAGGALMAAAATLRRGPAEGPTAATPRVGAGANAIAAAGSVTGTSCRRGTAMGAVAGTTRPAPVWRACAIDVIASGHVLLQDREKRVP